MAAPILCTAAVDAALSAMDEVCRNWDGRDKKGYARRFIEATVDESDLKTLAEDIRLAIDQFQARIIRLLSILAG